MKSSEFKFLIIITLFSISTIALFACSDTPEYENLQLLLSNHYKKLTIYGLYSDNMVLQRNRPIHINGWDKPLHDIVVEFNGFKEHTKSDENGNWSVDFEPMPENSNNQEMIITGSVKVTFHNLLIGDVWIASGQSNMSFEMEKTLNWNAVKDKISNHLVRLIKIPRKRSPAPINLNKNIGAQWYLCTSENAQTFSAVGYYFADTISRSTEIPIGIIDSSLGGTRIQAWCDKDSLISTGYFTELDFEDLEEQSNNPNNNPSVLYNAMIYPLANTAIKGVIWYQGEQDVEIVGQDYEIMMNTLLKSWRHNFNNPDLPLFFVQIPFYSGYAGELLGELTSKQYDFVKNNSNTDIVAINDTISDFDDVHPKQKNVVGYRLANLASNIIYFNDGLQQNNAVFRGPSIKNAYFSGSEIIINFSDVGSGLTTWNNKNLAGFEIAESDERYVDATAEIVGNTVRLFNSEVLNPVYIRTGYAYSEEKIFNLGNIDGFCSPTFKLKLE